MCLLSISTHATVSNKLSKFASYSKLHHKSTTHSMSTTRFIEYGHRHIESILRNMKVLNDGIPNIIESKILDQNTKNDFRGWLYQITNPSLIIRLLVIDKNFYNKFYENSSTMQKF